MSTNKTTNYQLHKWEAEDDFLRTEFNENFAAIDEALHRTYRSIFGKYTGVYETSDATPVRFDLDVKPRFVLVVRNATSCIVGMQTPENQLCEAITVDESGFTVCNVWGKSIYLHQKGATYTYLVLY